MGEGNGHHGKSKEQQPSLDEKVDWMTFTHQQLFDMLDKGVDLASANQVKDGWAKLATELEVIKKDLLQAVVDSSEGWRGESAQKARDGLISVVDWAENTSTHAAKVEACITSEIQHVVEAKNKMPVPAPAPQLIAPVVQPATPLPPTMISPAARARVVPHEFEVERFAAYDSPVGIESLRAQPQLTSPWVGISQVGAPVVNAATSADATHRQAADVMAWFQQSSYAVDQTVPQFSPPTNPVAPLVPTSGPGTGSAPLPPVVDGSTVVSASTAPEVADKPHTTASAQQRGGGGFSSMRGDFAAGGFSAVMANPAAGGGGGGSLSGPGSSAGVLGNASDAARSAAGAGAAAAASGGGQSGTRSFNPASVMGAPMAPGAAPAARSDDERDYQRASYLEDDDNLFGVERKAAPPVIGQ